MTATLTTFSAKRSTARPESGPEQLRRQLRQRLKSVLAGHFDRFIPKNLDDTFRPITTLTSLITRRREHIARLQLRQAVIGVILEGAKEIHLGGEIWHLRAGDCLLLPAGIEIDVVNVPDEASGYYRAIVLNLPAALILRTAAAYPAAVANGTTGNQSQSPLLPVTAAAIDSLVHAVQDIATPPAGITGDLARQLIEHRVMEVILHFAGRILVGRNALPAITDRVRIHLRSHPERAWTAADLAAELNMSEATLRRQLKADGQGFKKLLDDARMDLAKRLLPDRALSIDSIALTCGYAARGKFEQRFRKLLGMTPQRFRLTS
ncbi:MAG TPA: AraC family transcriptional regulator [Dongiaceae bacterium]